MKPKFLLILAMVMMIILACNFLPGNSVDMGSDQGGQSGSESNGQAGSTTQEKNSNSNSGKGNPGPKTLRIDDEALNAEYTTSVDQHNYWIIEGVDPSGAEHSIAQEIISQVQAEPEWAQYYYRDVLRNGSIFDFSEFAIQNGQHYSVNDQQTCSTREDQTKHEPAIQPSIYLQELEGTLKRAETGVMVNGVLTDRYELTKKNIHTAAVQELISGNLYRAQEGGYLVKFEFTAMFKIWEGSAYEKEFDITKLQKWTYLFEQTYYQPGALQVKMPAACANVNNSSSGSADSSTFEGVPADIPMPEKSQVTDIFVVSDMISYNTTLDLATITDFYRTGMVTQGWSLITDRPGDGNTYFDFTKDGRDTQMNITAGEGANPTQVVMYIK